jgi:hypothetical protein
MEEAKDLGMSSVCAVSDEPNIEDIKSLDRPKTFLTSVQLTL